MVRATLEGRKTQARLVIKPQPQGETVAWGCGTASKGFGFRFGESQKRINCPYGEPGDRLWLKETWFYEEHMHDLTYGEPDLPGGRYSHRCIYRATNPEWCVNVGVGATGWRPSIHMPRWASRITLEITGIRVERLQSIADDDIQAEGVRYMSTALIGRYERRWEPQHWLDSDAGPSYCRVCAEKALRESTEKDDFIDGGYSGASIETDMIETCARCGKMLESSPLSLDEYLPDENGEYLEIPPSPEEVAMIAGFRSDSRIDREVFRVTWDSLNAKRPGCSWDDNPWVWGIEFQRV
jgi:hypothetical protein